MSREVGAARPPFRLGDARGALADPREHRDFVHSGDRDVGVRAREDVAKRYKLGPNTDIQKPVEFEKFPACARRAFSQYWIAIATLATAM